MQWKHKNGLSLSLYHVHQLPGPTPENSKKRPFVEAFAEAISDGAWPQDWVKKL